MSKLWLLLFFQPVFAVAVASAALPENVQGTWKMIEQYCVGPNTRTWIAPGFPGSREDWILQFKDLALEGDYRFEAIYQGLSSQDCRVLIPGRFAIEFGPTQKISNLNLYPDRGAIKKSGSFEAPCKIFSTTRNQKFDARIERSKDTQGRNVDRLRLLGPDTEKRCENARDRMELLFQKAQP